MTKNILISMALAGSLSAGAIHVSAQTAVDVDKSQVDIVPAVISTSVDRAPIEGTLAPDHVVTLPDFLDAVPVPMPRPTGDFQISDGGNISSGELPLQPDGPLLPIDPSKFTGVVEVGTHPRFFAGSGSIEPFKPVLTESGVVIAEADIAWSGSDVVTAAPEGVVTLSVVQSFDLQRSAELSARATALEQLRTANPDQRAELIAVMSATQITQADEQRELARELRTELRALREERKGN